ncbi:MAG: ERF family protein [Clostridia bacterium]|nr:ERF family protein [Clostridia bacterium]
MANIFEKMSAITAELQTVGKNLTVGTGSNKYKAVSERDILDAVKPIEAKHGVYSYPISREVLESNLLENEKSYTANGNTTTTKTTTFMTRIKTVYRFVNIEKPDEYIETTTFAEGIDSQDKGSGKAMTYADKYALMKGYKISTGDDPDQTASEELHFKEATPIKSTSTPGKAPQEQTPRDRLIAKLKKLGIDATAYAKEKGLNKDTPSERYTELLTELGNE